MKPLPSRIVLGKFFNLSKIHLPYKKEEIIGFTSQAVVRIKGDSSY